MNFNQTSISITKNTKLLLDEFKKTKIYPYKNFSSMIEAFLTDHLLALEKSGELKLYLKLNPELKKLISKTI